MITKNKGGENMQERLWSLRRNSFKLSQQEVADVLGITVQAYRNKEQGKNQFTQDEMFMLSEFFKEPIDEIFLPRDKSINN